MIDLSRRRFLIGTAASVVAAAPIARAIAKPPTLEAFAERSAYAFAVLPDVTSMVAPEKQLIPIRVYRIGNPTYVQVERGPFPTSYIPTTDGPRTRAADLLTIDTQKNSGYWDLTVDPSSKDGFKFVRASVATRVNPQTGRIEVVPPNQPRFERGGLLIEESRSNLLLYSQEPWPHQELRLQPGDYVVSWSGDGHIRIEGEAVALCRPLTKRATWMPRRLSNAELAKLTEG